MGTEAGRMMATPPPHPGDRLTRFRFDLVPTQHAGNPMVVVVLTAETSTGEVFAWAIGQPLADKLHQDMTAAAARLGHSINPQDPSIAAFDALPIIGLLPDGWLANRDLAPQVIHLEVWPTVYVLDVSGVDGVARRISLPPGLAVEFAQQLGDAVDAIREAMP